MCQHVISANLWVSYRLPKLNNNNLIITNVEALWKSKVLIVKPLSQPVNLTVRPTKTEISMNNSPPDKIIHFVLNGKFVPLYSDILLINHKLHLFRW